MPNPMDAMCWVSPADEKGNVDNLLSRVTRLEEILSQLLGSDVSALQLSDITPKAGVLEDLTAVSSNAAGGWVTDGSFTGVAISTLGWTMSDGNSYPIVQMVDGVLQYGLAIPSGTSSTGNPITGVGSALLLYFTSGGHQEIKRQGTFSYNYAPSLSSSIIVEASFPTGGLYLVNANIRWLTTLGSKEVYIYTTSGSDPFGLFGYYQSVLNPNPPTTFTLMANVSRLIYSPTAISIGVSGGDTQAVSAGVEIVKLG